MLVHLGLPQWQMRCEVKPIQSFFLFNQIRLLQMDHTFESNPTCAGSLRWVRLLGLNSCSPCSRLTCSNHLVNKIKIKIHPPRFENLTILQSFNLTSSNHLVNKRSKIHPPRSDKMIIVLVVVNIFVTNNEVAKINWSQVIDASVFKTRSKSRKCGEKMRVWGVCFISCLTIVHIKRHHSFLVVEYTFRKGPNWISMPQSPHRQRMGPLAQRVIRCCG